MIEIRQVETSVNLLKYYMKKVHFILWFIQAVLFSTVVEAAPIDHKEAIRIADKFMFSNRENILDKCERAISELNQLCVVNYVFQNRAVGFVIVGLDDSLPSPILAFSPFGRVNLQNGTMKKLLDSYSHEIIEWQEDRTRFAAGDTIIYYQRKNSVCQPLLQGISWGQGSPYNDRMPLDGNGKKYLAGCTAVSVGQIMKYYEYPLRGTGKSSYIQTDERGKSYSLTADYDSLHIDWNSIKNKYDLQESTDASESVSRLLYYCAVAAAAKFSPETTTGYVKPITMALHKNFGYHPSIRYIRKNELSGVELQQLFYRELEAKRPVLCCGLSHFFVCDGFADDYFHINWGWRGAMDGYFKLSVFGAKADKLQIFDDVIVNIRPCGLLQEKHKTVNLQQPGDLCQYISDEEARTLTSLTVTGKLNGKDFYLLRKMAGAIRSVWEDGGELCKLDLSKTEIVADSVNPYYKENLTKMKFVKKVSRRNPYGMQSWTFKFETMDDKEWELLCQLKGDRDYRNHSWKFVKDGNDYYIQYYLSAHTISAHLFRNCIHLKELILPDQTLEIQPAAFADCKSLRQMSIPSQTKVLYPNAWQGCLSIQSVSVSPSNSEFMAKEGVLYSKDSTMLVYYPANKSDSLYIMPGSVSYLRSYAFNEALFLRDVRLSGQLKKIPRYAFSQCPLLRSVKLPESIVEIISRTFAGCNRLSTVFLPSKLQKVEDDAFFRCDSLTAIYSLNVTPPQITSRTFGQLIEKGSITLWIPKGSVQSYKQTPWAVFKNVAEF